MSSFDKPVVGTGLRITTLICRPQTARFRAGFSLVTMDGPTQEEAITLYLFAEVLEAIDRMLFTTALL